MIICLWKAGNRCSILATDKLSCLVTVMAGRGIMPKKFIYSFVFLVTLLCSLSAIVCAAGKGVNAGEKTANLELTFIPFPVELQKYEVYPWEMTKKSEFYNSYKSTIANKTKDKWLKTLSGPSGTNRLVASTKGNLVVVNSCKPHYCDERYIAVLFDPQSKKIWALLVEKEENKETIETWFGNPDRELEQILKAAQ